MMIRQTTPKRHTTANLYIRVATVGIVFHRCLAAHTQCASFLLVCSAPPQSLSRWLWHGLLCLKPEIYKYAWVATREATYNTICNTHRVSSPFSLIL